MKSYTDIEQSKKLAEFLPIESADMIYIMYSNGEKPQNGDENLSTVYESSEHKWYWIDIIDESWDMRTGEDIPCWSLAALLGVIPKPDLVQNSEGTWLVRSWVNAYPWSVGGYSNPIDACVAMIEKLHKLKIL
jgi:hypothetical protein